MGGKTAQTSQQVSIPPDVLARYQAVNASAQTAASTPFQTYSTNPNAFVAPLTGTQTAGISATSAAAGQAQPYYGAATGVLEQAQNATSPYYSAATSDLGQAQGVGTALATGSLGSLAGAQAAGTALNNSAGADYTGAYSSAQPYNQGAEASYLGGLAAAQPLQAQATGNIQGAQGIGTALGLGSLGTLGSASAASTPLLGSALSGIQNSAAAAQPYNAAAAGLASAGAGAVNAAPIDAASINQYMNPYLNTVLGSTSALLNQNNQQQQAGQLGNAINSGAFGGDRAGIAAANLEQQQNLSNANIYSGIASNAFNTALATAQQQQGVNLGAGQANRAALQTASGELQGIGQQGFEQGQTAATNTAGVAGQLYNQGLSTSQQQSAEGQALSALGLNTAAAQAGLGQQEFAQEQTLGSNTAALGQQVFGQGTALGTAQQGLGAQEYGQGANTAAQLAALGQQQFGQGVTASQQAAGIGQDIYGTGAATSQGLAGLGAGAQTSALQGAQAQLAAGTQAQQTQQAGLTALYNQFLQQQSYPFQVQQFLANIAEGTGALSGSTTTTTQPQSIFSDERLKEGAEPIGKTFDGENIYKFRYKGQPTTHVGLMAGEVEKSHPEAVGLASGYKTVDYDKATADAAEKGHFRRGGLAVNDEFDDEPRRQYAVGGYPTLPGAWVGDESAELAAQGQPFEPYTAGGLYGSSASAAPRGGSSYVPAANLPVGHLAVAQGMPAQTSALAQADQIANLIKGLKTTSTDVGRLGSKGGLNLDNLFGAAGDVGGDLSNVVALNRRRGGGLAIGGVPDDADPGLSADDATAKGLSIPNDKPATTSLALPGAPPPAPKSGLGELLDLAKTAAEFIPKAKGGRAGYEDGGSPDDGSDSPSPSGFAAGAQPISGLNALLSLAKLAHLGQQTVGGGQPPPASPPTSPVSSVTIPIGDQVKQAYAMARAAHNRRTGLAVDGNNPPAPPPPPDQDIAAPNPVTANTPSPLTAQAPSSAGPLASGLAVQAPQGTSAGQPSTGPSPLSGIESALGKAGHWAGNELKNPNVLLSLLAGIGAAGTTPTVHPGMALAAGLGAGAQTYAGLRQQSADIARTQAETQQEIPAIVGAQEAGAYKTIADTPHPAGTVLVEGAGPAGTSTFTVGGKPYHYELSVNFANYGAPNGGTEGTGAAGAADATQPSARRDPLTTDYKTGTYSYGPSSDTDSLVASQYGVDPSQPGVANLSRMEAKNPQAATLNDEAAKTAQERIGSPQDVDTEHRQLLQLAQAFNSLSNTGPTARGAGFDDRIQLANIYKTVSDMFGLPSDPTVSSDLDRSQLIDKIRTLAGANLAHSDQLRAQQMAKALSNVLTGGQMQLSAGNDILSTMLVNNQQRRDFQQYYPAYVSRYGVSLGAEQNFARDFNPIYDNEQKMLPKLFTKGPNGTSVAEYLATHPEAKQQVEQGGKRANGSTVPGWGNGVTRYFQ